MRRSELRRKTKIAGAAGAAIGATALFAPAAQAADFTVNSLADPGIDGTCDPLDPGVADCTLREAIEEANDAPGADTILFAAGLSGTVHLTEGDIEIYDGLASDDYGGLTIQGPGPGVITVDADYYNRIFDADGFYQAQTPVSISGLKLRGGDAERDGGAIRNWDDRGGYTASLTVNNSVLADNYAEDDGGAIFHDEEGPIAYSLTITDTRIVDNRAGAFGGGVHSVGSRVTITGSQINDNVAEYSGGGLSIKYAYGSETQAAVTITGSEINNNRALGLVEYGPPPFAFGGGALFHRTETVVIDNTTVAYNQADPGEDDTFVAFGGGIAGYEVGGTYIGESTIANNASSKYGGGIGLYDTYGTLVQNTTITGNEAVRNGGGVWLDEFKYARFENSTITDNDAWAADNGSSGYGGGIHADDGDTLEVSSTIVAENNDRYEESPDIAGSVTFDLDFSLIGDVSGPSYNDIEGNILGGQPGDPDEPPVDPLLAPLSDNGGPTLTHLPLAGSPALDAGISNGLATDQRGLARTVDLPEVANAAGSDATDMGSVEVQGQPQQPPPPQPGATGECRGSQVPLITGTGAGEELVGTPGRDLIRGGGGKDQIDGLEADDCLFGEADGDIVNGDSGDDLVDGGDGDDILSGVQGSDEVHGGAGVDRVKGNAGDDALTGGAERDVLAGGGGQDNLRGQGGSDKLRGAEASDKIRGGGGADKIKGAGGDDTINGGGGDDRINCGAGDDVANADPGDTVAANCETVN